MKRAAWMIEQLRQAQERIVEMEARLKIDPPEADQVFAFIEQVIDELEGEAKAEYRTERLRKALDDTDDLFGEAAERDGSAWAKKKEGK